MKLFVKKVIKVVKKIVVKVLVCKVVIKVLVKKVVVKWLVIKVFVKKVIVWWGCKQVKIYGYFLYGGNVMKGICVLGLYVGGQCIVDVVGCYKFVG